MASQLSCIYCNRFETISFFIIHIYTLKIIHHIFHIFQPPYHFLPASSHLYTLVAHRKVRDIEGRYFTDNYCCHGSNSTAAFRMKLRLTRRKTAWRKVQEVREVSDDSEEENEKETKKLKLMDIVMKAFLLCHLIPLFIHLSESFVPSSYISNEKSTHCQRLLSILDIHNDLIFFISSNDCIELLSIRHCFINFLFTYFL